MKNLLLITVLSTLIACGCAGAMAQTAKGDEQILRDLISRADKDPNAVKYAEDAIFASGAFPRPVVGRAQWDAMRSNRKMTNARLNSIQKTEFVRLVVSKSGDLAYDFGNFTLSYDTPDKQHVAFDGSYLRVWHKIKGEWMTEAFFARPNEDAKTATNAAPRSNK